MQLTTQTRPELPPSAVQSLDRLTAFYGTLLHKLYARMAAAGGKAQDHKTAFCAGHGITARFFNGLANDLQGTLDGTRELLKARAKDLRGDLAAAKRGVKELDKKFEKVRLDHLRPKPETLEKWEKKHAKLNKRITRDEHKLTEVERRLDANVPGIGFGSRKLFKKQYNLEENGYADHAEWLADWRAARAHQCFFIGSGDETGGNQSCTLSASAAAGPSTLTLRIRLPDAIRAPGEGKYLLLEGLAFPCDEPALRAALARGQALSWLIHRDRKGYRLMVSFARPAGKVTTLDKRYGCVGVDFNADHLAVTETDMNGNLIGSKRIDLPFAGKSTGQRAALLSDALEQVLEWALRAKKPIVVEDLDFEQKKKQLGQMTAAQARMLSGLAYAKYQQLVASKCHRRGVTLLKVNPAHTSVAGRLKYARPKGLSVHQAAAGAIARRGQGFTEKLPRTAHIALHVHGVTTIFPAPVRKPGVSRRVAWQGMGKELRVFLRKHWLATRGPASTAGRASAKGKRAGRGAAPSGPSGGAVPSAGKKSLKAQQVLEQICPF